MPLPAHAITIHGGCLCKAIRYKIFVPPIEERSFHASLQPPHSASDAAGTLVRQPYCFTCNCNTCRESSGALFYAAISTPIKMVQVALVACHITAESVGSNQEWHPAENIFRHFTSTAHDSNSYLGAYLSSGNANRYFCSRCGTHLGFRKFPNNEVEPIMDLVLGSVDRHDLDKEYMLPERHLWWSVGIEWIKAFLVKGWSDIDRHPESDMKHVSH